MSTWTLEHAKAIVAAWPEVQMHMHENHWVSPRLSLAAYPTENIGDPSKFRLPPKKKLVEWTASDVKPGMVFRHKKWPDGEFITVHAVRGSGISWDGFDIATDWKKLKEIWLWSTDAVNWHPCAKEVEG